MELLINKFSIKKACKGFLSRFFALLFIALLSNNLLAKGVYQTTDEYATEIWPEGGYSAEVHWLQTEDKAIAKAIFERNYAGLRVRYKRFNNQTLWTMEEVGKELPITVGIWVGDSGVEEIRILAYRESRGGEVKYPFFTRQFIRSQLTERFGISAHIDNISGATLSVAAVKRTVAWALYLHKQVTTPVIEPL